MCFLFLSCLLAYASLFTSFLQISGLFCSSLLTCCFCSLIVFTFCPFLRIPGMVESGGLSVMGSHRVDKTGNLAAAALHIWFASTQYHFLEIKNIANQLKIVTLYPDGSGSKPSATINSRLWITHYYLHLLPLY